MSSTTITRRRAPLTTQERQERQTELLNTLADGVAELATSEGWARFLRAMSTLRRYSTGNGPIFQTREYPLSTEERPAWQLHEPFDRQP